MTQEVSDRFWQAEGRLKGRKDGTYTAEQAKSCGLLTVPTLRS